MNKEGIVWANQEDFIKDIKNIVTQEGTAKTYKLLKFPFNFLFQRKDDFRIDADIRNIIDECSDPEEGPGFLIKRRILNSPHLRLSSRGREIYAFSYLIGQFFGNQYIKWTFTAFIVWFLAHQFNIIIHS